MSKEEMKTRAEVPVEQTWDTSALYETKAAFDQAVEELKKSVTKLATDYEGKLTDAETIISALKDYGHIEKMASWTYHYAFLPESTDITNAENVELSRSMSNLLAEIGSKTTFFAAELKAASDDVLDEVVAKAPQYASFIRHIKKDKKIQLELPVEKALARLSPVLNAPENIYEQARLADMDFGTFEAEGKVYPLSFVLYEDYYAYHPNTAIRRAAFDKFSNVLAQYQNVVAAAYYTQVQKEKTIATMRGFDSIFDYLLYDQEVDRAMYDRQIDTIMSELAPVMQKYITHLKEENSLDKMTYADVKIDLDAAYSPEVTIEASKGYVEEAIAILGQDYVARVMKAYPERWVDFAQNKGKSTGGFCTSPYGTHPYVLMSWTGQLSDVYTLIHEFGHAAQGLLAAENNDILGVEPSLYLIEAPSTFNELLLTHSLQQKATNARLERYALAKMITNTYFHNFITHLLEAAYQREVYQLVDEGKGFDAAKLNELKRNVLKQFWGDAVEINPGAELTWMRQVHYYMGLYSYTYSAGLTIATQAFLRIKEEGAPAVEDWLTFLKTGDQFEPAEAAKVAGIDITTDKPLKDTIHFLDESVDRIIELTQELKDVE